MGAPLSLKVLPNSKFPKLNISFLFTRVIFLLFNIITAKEKRIETVLEAMFKFVFEKVL